MRQEKLRPPALVLLALVVPALAWGGEAAKTAIVKGTVTINGRPTADAVISVEGLPEEIVRSRMAGLKAKKAVIEQRDLKFIPRVLPVLVGTTVEFPNHDKTFHNVFSTSEAKRFDLGLYPPRETRSVTFEKPGVVRVLCNVHPNMEAFVVVKGHPFFAASDQRGLYQLSGVPLGRHRLEIWHPEFGARTESVNLRREGEVLTVNVDLARR